MINDYSPVEILTLLPLIILSLTVHEHAHARTAWSFGDSTARDNGRMTLNPLAHLDLIGTLAMIFAGFGWAKPVPVNPFNLHPVRLGNIAVSLAGPASNLLLAVVSLLLMGGVTAARTHGLVADNIYLPIYQTLFNLARINIVLCVFNLVPLYPLDGHHVLGELLPHNKGQEYMRWQLLYGRVFLIALLVGPILLARVTNNDDFPNPLTMLYNYTDNTINTIMRAVV